MHIGSRPTIPKCTMWKWTCTLSYPKIHWMHLRCDNSFRFRLCSPPKYTGYISAVQLQKLKTELYDHAIWPLCSYVDGNTLNILTIASEITFRVMSFLYYPYKKDMTQTMVWFCALITSLSSPVSKMIARLDVFPLDIFDFPKKRSNEVNI